MLDERGQQVIRDTSWLPAHVAMLVCVYFFFGTGGVSGQSRNSANPTLGRIILIEPKEPKGALKVRQANRVDPVNAVEGMLIRRG